MIIIEMNGGLGNQLQQYALYEKFKALGKEVKLDTSWFTVKESAAEKTTPDGKAREEKTTKRKLELGSISSLRFLELYARLATSLKILRRILRTWVSIPRIFFLHAVIFFIISFKNISHG